MAETASRTAFPSPDLLMSSVSELPRVTLSMLKILKGFQFVPEFWLRQMSDFELSIRYSTRFFSRWVIRLTLTLLLSVMSDKAERVNFAEESEPETSLK